MRHVLSRRAALAGAIALLAGCAAPKPKTAQSRDIGFDLWCGRPGAKFGDKIAVTHGSRTISGPMVWTHPITNEVLSVYERRNREANGDKIQLFRLAADGQSLGRVFDSRPGRGDRHFTGDAFFPLGPWSRGERRSWAMTEHEGGKTNARTATIRIRRLSFTDDGVDGALRHDWMLMTPDKKVLFDERYVHAPGIGFVSFSNRLR